MPILHVNVDHIATIRQARKTTEPDPVYGALLAEQAGAGGITIHLREDRRHIQDRDLKIAREMIQTRLNLEMATTKEMVEIAINTKPDIVTLVPEKRQEVTTEGGLDCISQFDNIQSAIKKLKDEGIRVSVFIDPEFSQIDAAKKLNADDIELHTGEYANAKNENGRLKQLNRLIKADEYGNNLNLKINAGHGLTYFNITPIAKLKNLQELNIGHSIISRSAYVGITQAVQEMILLINNNDC